MSGWNLMDTYELHETLGSGGGGTVIRAYHKRLQKDVVIKKIHTDIQNEGEKRIEADILKNLHHQYLPQVYDYFVEEGIAYTVMDYVQGESFGQKLVRGERFSEKKLLKYARQLCEALDYLHSQKLPVIHGDIKPDNIMLTPEDNVCLIDFNISGITKNGHAVTFGYTEGYGAPEQYREFQRLSALTQSPQKAEATELLSRPQSQAEATELLNRPQSQAEATELLNRPQSQAEATELLNRSQSQAEATELLNRPQSQTEATELLNRPQPQPELTEGIPIDKRSDIYSLGATLYHIYSGQVLRKDGKNDISGKISEGFLYILNKALQENPNNRYQDAGQMLAAVNNLYKYDSRYRNMKVRHMLVYMLLTAVLLCGVYFVLHGRDVYEKELLAKYDNYIKELTTARVNGDDEEFEALFREVVDFMPDRLEAYYQKALFLFETRQYQEDIYFIRKTLDENSAFYSTGNVGGMYYIMGNAYFELENYENAADAFANAVKYDEDNAAYYVDEAIANARNGNVEKAKRVLESAEKKGALSDTLYLANGEIKLAEEDYESAEEDFRISIRDTKDDYTKMRAYVMCSKAILQQGSGRVEDGISLLDEALYTLPDEYHGMILEQLTNVYEEGYKATQDIRYAEGVLDTLKKIEAAGWATFVTYDNMVNIYYRLGDYEAEKQLLEKLAQSYPNQYKIPMKQAFLEVTLQAQKPQNNRDYSDFTVYYEQAEELYNAAKNNEQRDPEMQVLENAYQELVDGNWIN